MNRFNFVECLVRIAYQKYDGFRKQELVQSMYQLLENELEPWLSNEQQRVWGTEQWRKTQLFTEDVHRILDMNMSLMRDLHRLYSYRNDREVTWAK